ncbi:cytochrome P450 [Paenibacillus sp. BIHB 4019]|uniref:Cytochrome P450 n=1 Tax=Paenibacillus sp. BIHB 4019 TaxID=1870819 RepID=A0A1B2DL01_9BACL|nr:cytochrome P450 [Paenibacillus sp. BIHB 4019]ANY68394.1 cytochrome P450 [Paenibacillus sp. BIHB 4019]
MSELIIPPGPKGKMLLGNLPDFGKDPLGYLTQTAESYGDLVKMRLEKDRDTILVSHPDHIEYILMQTNKIFSKGYHRDRIMSMVLGNGLVTSEGDFWLRQRRLSQPAFHRNRIHRYGEHMLAYAGSMLAEWQDGQTRDIHEDMMDVTMNIVAKSLFDADLQKNADHISSSICRVMTEYNTQMGSIFQRLLSLLPITVPTPGNAKLKKSVEQLDGLIYEMIASRRTEPGDRGDLLSMLLEARDDDGSAMSELQLRDEIMTMFLAGHETTANTLSWALHLLATHPEIQNRLLAEVREKCAGGAIQVTDFPELTFAHYIIKETMRLYPPVWIISRETLQDVELGGFHIPKGTEVSMSQWVMHRHPRYFEDPLSFMPERWENDFEKRLSKYVYFPFGGGPRFCIGNNFALMEAVLLLAAIVQRFEIVPSAHFEVIPEASITLRPKHGLSVQVKTR